MLQYAHKSFDIKLVKRGETWTAQLFKRSDMLDKETDFECKDFGIDWALDKIYEILNYEPEFKADDILVNEDNRVYVVKRLIKDKMKYGLSEGNGYHVQKKDYERVDQNFTKVGEL